MVSACYLFIFPPFGPTRIEFIDRSAKQAESQLRAFLTDDLDLKDVEKVSGKICGAIDCHAGWIRITLRPESARQFQEAMHARLEKSARPGRGVELIEGVHLTMREPTLVESSLGTAPNWWTPPSIEFRVTEKMLWYSSSTTYAFALYTGFDPSTNKLWIYDYGEQHRQLWSRGAIPTGDQFVVNGHVDHGEPE